ncbi:hypothetical protein GIB67_019422 [Kingdonia uniflora]|uniref:Uncharacterized protein n=1 Tax=Kingdonia uniflora TaxID=39325 RepID=A0A7J7L6P1_9MAGN|nr:hypothetical protein GIB67_019422 [Kingdonia uniflora]
MAPLLLPSSRSPRSRRLPGIGKMASVEGPGGSLSYDIAAGDNGGKIDERGTRLWGNTCIEVLLSELLAMLMCLADLEFDYINPYDSARRINGVVLPEFISQGALCFLFLVSGHWVMFLISVPYAYYNVRMYMQRQHLVDITEIFNLLNWEKKQRLFKLVYLVVLLFMSIFWMIWSVLEDHDDNY